MQSSPGLEIPFLFGFYDVICNVGNVISKKFKKFKFFKMSVFLLHKQCKIRARFLQEIAVYIYINHLLCVYVVCTVRSILCSYTVKETHICGVDELGDNRPFDNFGLYWEPD
jgi:hypothetical protein